MGFRTNHIILLISCFVLSAYGQDTTRVLKPVPIIKEVDLNTINLESTNPHITITKAWMEQLGAIDIAEALKYSPGIQLKDYGGIGGVKSIAYRSLGANHTGVVIDGAFLPNVQSGLVNLNGFDLFGLNTVEFSSGQVLSENVSASAFLLPNTISVQSVLFERPDSLRWSYSGIFNTINAYENGVLIQVPLGQSFFIGGQVFYKFGSGAYQFKQPDIGINTTQIRENSALTSLRGKIVTGFDNKNSKLRFTGQFSDTDQELPGAVVLYNPSNDQYLWTDFQKYTLNYQFNKSKWLLNAQSFYQIENTEYLDEHYLNSEGFLAAEYQQENILLGGMLTRKLNKYFTKLFFGSDLIYTNLVGSNVSANPMRLQNNSVIGTQLTLGRFNVLTNLTNQYIQDNYTELGESIQKTNFNLSPFFSFSVQPFIKKALKIRAFYKSSYRMPTFNDLYYNAIGNKHLKPEEANLLNIGLSYKKVFTKFSFQTTIDGFYNQTKNKIIAIPTKDLFNWSMQNIGETEIKGIDFSAFLSTRLRKVLFVLSTSHSFNQTIDITDENNSTFGHQLPYTPQYTTSNGMSISIKGFALSVNALYNSFRYSLNENIYSNLLPAFSDFNLGLSKELNWNSSKVFISLKCMNLLNKNYQIIRSFPMPGRYYQAQIKYSFR
ncbi:TonB-dependent receptor plug domain-containing protein [Crocinitomix catalasitica]|uniref:TonB-dependent receptor plug domain-containing protein n=1 Tax=Crocinitomix catalasitica TaxID=184607 RepID=UPI000485BE61|nr:TonB-dependent receptor plug domain-containing protein [Crocinitomix catalasitica]